MHRIDELLEELLSQAGNSDASLKIGIAGHVRPDGDCVGSTTGLYEYLRANYSSMDVRLYLEYFKPQYGKIIPAAAADGAALSEYDGCRFDVLFVLDCADMNRVGVIANPRETADLIVCIDHHISNGGFGDINVIDAEASSASQVLFTLLEEEKINEAVANSLMTGIVHDTGVFRHQNTKPLTMEIASLLLSKGAKLSAIVNETYFQKSFAQVKITGIALSKAYRVLNDRVMCCVLTREEMDSVGASASDLDGIVDTLRGTEGIECAVFLYQTGEELFKVSLRSNLTVNVSEIAASYGGGGHVRAAGFNATGSAENIMASVLLVLEEKMR